MDERMGRQCVVVLCAAEAFVSVQVAWTQRVQGAA